MSLISNFECVTINVERINSVSLLIVPFSPLPCLSFPFTREASELYLDISLLLFNSNDLIIIFFLANRKRRDVTVNIRKL